MNPEEITVRPMDGNAVRCETEACGEPAMYLFVIAGQTSAVSARCDIHARALAGEANLKLPPSKDVRGYKGFRTGSAIA